MRRSLTDLVLVLESQSAGAFPSAIVRTFPKSLSVPNSLADLGDGNNRHAENRQAHQMFEKLLLLDRYLWIQAWSAIRVLATRDMGPSERCLKW